MPWRATELELRRLFYWSMRFTHWDSVRYVATVVAANEQLVLGGTSGASKTSAPQDLNLYTNFNVRMLRTGSSLPKFCFSHCCQVVLQIAPAQSGFQSENGRSLCNPQSMHAHARTRTQTPPCAQDVPTVLLTRPFATRTELGWAHVRAGGPAGGIGGSKLRIYELRLV
jgi:hypothetical protein